MQVGISTNIKLNTDKHHRYLQQGEYRWALNALPGEYQPFLSNDLSNKLCIELDGDLIGSIYIGDNNFILFTTANSIVRFNSDNCTQEYIIEKLTCLGFLATHQILGEFRQDFTCNDIYIYWVDNGLHNARYLNINDKKLIQKIIETQDCSLLSLQDCITSLPKLLSFAVLDKGGDLVSGVYEFAIRLGVNSSFTNWIIITKECISIIDDNSFSDFSDIDGCLPGTNTTKAIELNIGSLDTNYNQIQIAVIKTIQSVKTAAIIVDTTFSTDLFNYVYSNNETIYEELPIDAILIPKKELLFPKEIMANDNVLNLANFKERKKINYQHLANKIKVNYYVKTIKLADTNGYKHYLENYRDRSWMRDEVYALGIIWEFCDGTFTEAFPLIGREANEYDLEEISQDDPNLISCDLERWKNYNTAYRTELNEECINNTQNIGDIKTYTKICQNACLPGDQNVTPTGFITCSGQTVTYNDTLGHWVDNSYFFHVVTVSSWISGSSCWSVVSTWMKQVTFTLGTEYPTDGDTTWILEFYDGFVSKWARFPITGTDIEVDTTNPCYINQPLPCIYSRGELAYHEICEQYPIQYDCNGNLIYPCVKDELGNCVLDDSGKPIMENIRYFKMPDTRIEPHYSLEGGFNTSNELIGRVESYEADRGYWRPYEGIYIHTLGLEFTNIEMPNDIPDGSTIKGYRIVRVPRLGNNKTVIAKGLLHGTSLAEGDPDYAIPRHGINSNEYYFDYGGGGLVMQKGIDRESYVPAYTFISPDTTFNKPNLSAKYLKVEGQVYGKGRVYGDSAASTNNDFRYWGRRQNINLNGFITDANAFEQIGQNQFKPTEINRIVRGIQYAIENTLNINQANITYPLYNVWRESCVYLELNKFPYEEPLSDKLLTLQYYHAEEKYQSDEANINDIFFYDVDHSFYKGGYHCADYFLSGKDPVVEDHLDDSDELGPHGNCCQKNRPLPDYTANTWYVSLKRDICNIYGSVSSLIFNMTGLINHDIDKYLDLTAERQEGTFGDSFINYWSYRRSSVPAYYDGEKYRTGDLNGKPNADWCNLALFNDAFGGERFGPITLKTLVHNIVESNINVDFRHEGDISNWQIYYPKLGNSMISLDSAVPPNSAAEKAYLNRFSVSDLEKPFIPENFMDNYYAYNEDYSLTSNLQVVASISEFYKDCKCETEYISTIAYSLPQAITLNSDNWRVFLSENRVILPTNTGEITSLFVYGYNIYARTKDAIWRLFSNETRLKSTDNETIYLGSGDLYSQRPRELYASKEGYAGSSLRYCRLTNQFGSFWVDDKANIIYAMGSEGQGPAVKELSGQGMTYWFFENIPFCLLKTLPSYPFQDNPANKEGIGFHFVFDHLYNRVIVTKKDYEFIDPSLILGDLPIDETQCIQGGIYYKNNRLVIITDAFDCSYSYLSVTDSNYFCDKSWTMSYSFNTQGWVSWHSYISDFYLYTRNKFFSFNNNINRGDTGLFIHNVTCDYQKYYGIVYPHEIEYVLNTKAMTSIWSNLKYNTEAIKCDKTYLNGFTYDSLLLYNSNQSSGWLDLIYDEGTYQRHYLNYPEIYVDRNERFFMINGFNDYTNNTSYSQIPMFTPICGQCSSSILSFNDLYIDPIKDYKELQRLRDTWIAVRFRLKPQNSIKLINDYLLFINQNSVR